MRDSMGMYRGRRTDGWWVYGQLWGDSYGWFIKVRTEEGSFFDYNVDPETVGEFTGLTDREDKRIFEGDLVKQCSWIDWKINKKREWREAREIIYDDCCRFSFKGDLWKLFDTCGYEITGNIHDDPEKG